MALLLPSDVPTVRKLELVLALEVLIKCVLCCPSITNRAFFDFGIVDGWRDLDALEEALEESLDEVVVFFTQSSSSKLTFPCRLASSAKGNVPSPSLLEHAAALSIVFTIGISATTSSFHSLDKSSIAYAPMRRCTLSLFTLFVGKKMERFFRGIQLALQLYS